MRTSIQTNGIGFSSDGLFRLIGLLSKNKTIDYITSHFKIEYFDTNMEIWKNTNTNFDGISLHFRGFEI